MARHLLLTGVPGVGKTTVVRRVVESLGGRPMRGFLTDEIRHGGRRTGFRITTIDVTSETLASVDLRSPHRVGRYGVDVSAVDRIVAHSLEPTHPHELVIIDEIGKMECFSEHFVVAVRRLLGSPHTLLATVALHGGVLIAEVKRHPEVELWQIKPANRDDVPARVMDWLQAGP
jgi:nucleoside-triphosphatase